MERDRHKQLTEHTAKVNREKKNFTAHENFKNRSGNRCNRHTKI